MESKYESIYAGATVADLKKVEYDLVDQISEIEYCINDVPEFSELYMDLKKELSEFKYELNYVSQLINSKTN